MYFRWAATGHELARQMSVIDESNTPGSAGEIIDGWIRLDLATFSLQSSLLSSIASPFEGLTIGNPTALPEDSYSSAGEELDE